MKDILIHGSAHWETLWANYLVPPWLEAAFNVKDSHLDFGYETRQTWDPDPPLSLTCCLTLGDLLNFSEPQHIVIAC